MASTITWDAVGALMRSLRKASGVSLREAGRRAQMSHSMLANAESGRDRPSDRLIAFYESEFGADGLLWSAYTAARVPVVPEFAANLTDRPAYPLPGDHADFVRDVTIPDGTVMEPGESFVKTWRIHNVGSVAWAGRRLARLGPPVAAGLPSSPPSVPIPDTPPGAEVEISVPLRAQQMPGTSQITWKTVDAAGRFFYPDDPDGLLLCIVVRSRVHAGP